MSFIIIRLGTQTFNFLHIYYSVTVYSSIWQYLELFNTFFSFFSVSLNKTKMTLKLFSWKCQLSDSCHKPDFSQYVLQRRWFLNGIKAGLAYSVATVLTMSRTISLILVKVMTALMQPTWHLNRILEMSFRRLSLSMPIAHIQVSIHLEFL